MEIEFNENTLRDFLEVRDRVQFLLIEAGAFTLEKVQAAVSCTLSECAEYLEHLKYIGEIKHLYDKNNQMKMDSLFVRG